MSPTAPAAPVPAPKPAKPLGSTQKKLLNKLLDDYEPQVRWLVNDVTSRLQAKLPDAQKRVTDLVADCFKRADDALETKDDEAVTALFDGLRASLK